MTGKHAELTDDELKEILGKVGMAEFTKAPDSDKPKIRAWAARLAGMSDAELVSETASHILDAAILESFPRQNPYGVGCRVTACYQEARRRHVAAGHSEECRGETLYGKAHASAMRSQKHKPGKPSACTCGVDTEG